MSAFRLILLQQFRLLLWQLLRLVLPELQLIISRGETLGDAFGRPLFLFPTKANSKRRQFYVDPDR